MKFLKKKAETVTRNFNEKNAICKTKRLYIFLAFLLITVTLLIPVRRKKIYVTNEILTI